MSRARRLLDLIQILRRHRYPVTGAKLAGELDISLRTLYRDIATLQAQGASVEGEAGLGYVLRPGFMLPPLMFSEDEIEALVLGARWVAERGDERLAVAAADALARITAILPPDLRHLPADSGLLVGPARVDPDQQVREQAAGNHRHYLPLLRQAIRSEHTITLHYQDEKGAASSRTVWPFALGFFEHVRVLVAWCELRQDFRHFRVDRIVTLTVTAHRYPRRRQILLREWRDQQGIPRPA